MCVVTRGMLVIASEAINFEGVLDEVPWRAVEAVIEAKRIISERIGHDVSLNTHFTEVLDRTREILNK